jgi:hypothetical protein
VNANPSHAKIEEGPLFEGYAFVSLMFFTGFAYKLTTIILYRKSECKSITSKDRRGLRREHIRIAA